MGRRRRLHALDEDDDGAGSFHSDKPLQRNAANDRERMRMRVLSKAFSRLKTMLPWVPPDTKLSKLDTLRLATCYIAHLQKILDDDSAASEASLSVTPVNIDSSTAEYANPLKLTWPFAFSGRMPGSPEQPAVPQESSNTTAS